MNTPGIQGRDLPPVIFQTRGFRTSRVPGGAGVFEDAADVLCGNCNPERARVAFSVASRYAATGNLIRRWEASDFLSGIDIEEAGITGLGLAYTVSVGRGGGSDTDS